MEPRQRRSQDLGFQPSDLLDDEIDVNNWVEVQGPVKQTVANKLRDEGPEHGHEQPLCRHFPEMAPHPLRHSPAKGREACERRDQGAQTCPGLSPPQRLAAGAAETLFPARGARNTAFLTTSPSAPGTQPQGNVTRCPQVRPSQHSPNSTRSFAESHVYVFNITHTHPNLFVYFWRCGVFVAAWAFLSMWRARAPLWLQYTGFSLQGLLLLHGLWGARASGVAVPGV